MTESTPPAGEPTPESLGAARLTLAYAWSAVVGDTAAFGEPCFAWAGERDAHDVGQAAVYLAQCPKPLRLRASLRPDGRSVHLAEIAPADDDAAAIAWACFLRDRLPTDAARVVVLTGGRALRTGRAVVARWCADYVLEPQASIGGGPPDESWTTHLALPPRWLDGVSYVCVLGRREGNRSVVPLRASAGWPEDGLEDV